MSVRNVAGSAALNGYVQLNEAVANDELATKFAADHQDAFDKLDFASPLLALMSEAAKKWHLSGSQKKQSVVFLFKLACEKAYEKNPNAKAIALATADSLLQALYATSQFHSPFCYAYFFADPEKDPPVDPETFQSTVKYIADSCKEEVARGDIGRFLHCCYTRPKFSALKSDSYLRIQMLLAANCLALIFPDSVDAREQITPFIAPIYDALKRVDEHYMLLYPASPPEQQGCCGCILM